MYLRLNYFMIVFLILLTNDVLGLTADCPNVITVNDQWRSVHYQLDPKNPQCDENLEANQWYSFGSNADVQIPTQCVKNHACGTKVGMWLDLGGQTVTDDGSFIQAHLCGAYNVLEKYDCCVLRTPVLVAKCNGRLVYNILKKIDRCPVSICTQEIHENLHNTILAKSGQSYEETLPKSTDEAQTSPTKPLQTSTDTPTSEFPTRAYFTLDASYINNSESEMTESSTAYQLPDIDSITDPIVKTDTNPIDTTETLKETTVPDITTDETQTSPTKPLQTSTDTPTSEFSTRAYVTLDASYINNSESEITESSTAYQLPDIDSITDPIVKTDTMDTTETLTETTVPDITTTTESEESSSSSFGVISSTSQFSNVAFAATTVETSDSTESETVDAPQDTTGMFSTEESSPLELVMPLSTTTEASSTDLSSSMADGKSTVITDHTSSEPESSTVVEMITTPGMDSSSTSDEIIPRTDDDSMPGSADESLLTSTETSPESSSVENVTGQMESTSAFMEDMSSSTVQEDEAENEKPEKTSSQPSTIITTTTATPSTTTLTTTTQVVVTSRRPDVILTETVTLIFRGHLPNATIQVGNFMLSFLRRAANESEHKAIYELLPHIEVNTSCYSINRTCIELTLRSSGREGIIAVFKRLKLVNFFEENAHYDLIDMCIASEKCLGVLEGPEYHASKTQFERNAPVFITVITLCVVCLLVVIVGAFCTRVWKRGTYHAASNVESAELADKRHYVTETQSPFTDEQIMKDELVSNKADIVDKGSINGSALDGGENSTWVIPLDDALVPELGTIKCEDTKL